MKISIIIPTLNEEKVLKATLLRLRAILDIPYEIIVSDGKSTDGTLAIARQYADQTVIFNESRRQTIAEARNMGAAVATGDFYVFMDADVRIPDSTNFFKTLLLQFQNNPDLVGTAVFMKVIPENATISDALFFGIVNVMFYVMNNILHIGAAAGEFQMVRADIFKKTGGYNVKLPVGEDNEFFGRLARIGRTRTDADLHILHTSRRAHDIGWPMLLLTWLGNGLSVKLFKRSINKEWKVIR